MSAVETRERPARGAAFWGFVTLMVVLTGVFIALGTWQVERLGEKEALIAAVNARLVQAPVALPPAREWAGLRADSYQFRPLTASGHYLPEATVLVFTSLSEPRGQYGGPGYLVVTPLAVEGGGVIYVNRGFVPQSEAAGFKTGGHAPVGTVTVSGIGRSPEAVGSFTPGSDLAGRVDYVRDPSRLKKFNPTLDEPVAPITLDLPAGPAGALPQGGETVVDFPNNHLGYAMTWFGFAVITPVLLGYWIWRQRRPSA